MKKRNWNISESLIKQKMRSMSVHFDDLYIKYSRLYAYGADLKKILKQKELEEDFETCEVILHVMKDHKVNKTSV